MGECPFCSAEISEELSLYGGTCSACLIDIPGEEAVTDPGVSDGTAGAGGTPTGAVGTSSIPLAAWIGGGLLAVVAVIVIAVQATPGSGVNPDPGTGPGPGGEVGTHVNIEGMAPEPDEEQAEAVAAEVVGSDGESEALAVETVSESSAQSTYRPRGSRSGSQSSSQPEVEEEPQVEATVVRSESGGVVVNVERDTSIETEALSGEMASMAISAVQSRVGKKFKACIARHESGDVPLRGSVNLQYTVQTDGTISGVELNTSAALKDPGLSSCFGKAANEIRFAEFASAQPVEHSFVY